MLHRTSIAIVRIWLLPTFLLHNMAITSLFVSSMAASSAGGSSVKKLVHQQLNAANKIMMSEHRHVCHACQSDAIKRFHWRRKFQEGGRRLSFIPTAVLNKHLIFGSRIAPISTLQYSTPVPFRQTLTLSSSFSSGGGINKMTGIQDVLLKELQSGMPVHEVLRLSVKILEEYSIPEPDESVLHLLSYALSLDWDNGYRQLREVSALPPPLPSMNNSIQSLAQQTLTSEQCTRYISFLDRRLQFEPLQYIVGKWDFHHLIGLNIRKPMLCPRPETEELVELVLEDIRMLIETSDPVQKREKIRILDVGCGTGAIGIAIAHLYPKHVEVLALDVSSAAVELSNENANNLLSDCIHDGGESNDGVGRLYQAILCSAKDFTNTENDRYDMNFDIVVSNPPYIPSKDMQDLTTDVVGYESRNALCGGDDGLDVIRDIIHRLPEWLSSPSGFNPIRKQLRYCWMEVDDSHPAVLAHLLAPGSKDSKLCGVEYCSDRKDFCGRHRFVKIKCVR
jgi:release factor glutamine methyltransferase